MQILTSGFTYDHTYWDFPHEPETYSYVEAATAAGYTTFNYDRLGLGRSGIPANLPEDLSVANHARVLHQLVKAARAGKLAGQRFKEVISVGHSLGSSIALYEAGAYGDVDALVLTGTMRETQPGFTGVPLHPAVEDPKFLESGLPSEIMTSIPGQRGEVFYHLPNADPAVVLIDEALKQTGVPNELVTIPSAYAPDTAGRVDVPVLFVLGQRDWLFCNSEDGFPCDTAQDVVNRQADMVSNAACVDAVVVADTGHDLNLHRNAPDVFETINHWDRCGAG